MMNKEIKIELFNIYAMVVFEDETGITQDCVCVIGKDVMVKDKGIGEMVDIVECNNHSISIYEDGSYKVWEKDGKNLPYYATNKKIIHLYTLTNDNRFIDVYPINDYESIENLKSSKALKALEVLNNTISPLLEPILTEYEDDLSDKINANYFALKQELLKAQEQERMLKIIDEKGVDIGFLKTCKTVEQYNAYCWGDDDVNKKLTEVEFIILKRHFKQ